MKLNIQKIKQEFNEKYKGKFDPDFDQIRANIVDLFTAFLESKLTEEGKKECMNTQCGLVDSVHPKKHCPTSQPIAKIEELDINTDNAIPIDDQVLIRNGAFLNIVRKINELVATVNKLVEE